MPSAEAGMSTRVSFGRRLTFLILSIPSLAAVALFIYLPMTDADFRDVGGLVISILLILVFGFFSAVGLANAFRSHSPLWGPMPTRRFVRFMVACSAYGLVFALLMDGIKWVERRSWFLGQLVLWGLAILYAVQGANIRRGMRWLSLGDGPLPEKPAS